MWLMRGLDASMQSFWSEGDDSSSPRIQDDRSGAVVFIIDLSFGSICCLTVS